MFNECRSFGVLPRAGGWVDQDEMEMSLMRLTANVAVVYEPKRELSDDDAGLIAWVEDDG